MTTVATVSVPVAEVDKLTVRLPTRSGGRRTWVSAATDVTLALVPGSVTALIGESGGGKSVLASALCGLLPLGAQVHGTIRVAGQDMSNADERQWREIRGRTVGLACQSGDTSLTPVRTVGSQLDETIAALDADTTTTALLGRVGLEPTTAALYPHELSGGMAQRISVAAALASSPRVLVADEPTAGLDPELATHILGLLRSAADGGAAVLLITHDLQLLEDTGTADEIVVIRSGRILEKGFSPVFFASPRHPYSTALLTALPSHGLRPMPVATPGSTRSETPTAAGRAGIITGRTNRRLVAEHITCTYGTHKVLQDVTVCIEPGRILGLTGPSGTGKTSLARILTGLQIPDDGTVTVDGHDLITRRGRMNGTIGLLHQSPRAATDPRIPLHALITQPLHGRTRRARSAAELAARVGLTPDLLDRRPSQVSDGQLQRACLARALAARPRYLVCDEPTATLDAAATAAVAALLRELADDGVGVLVISHDHPLLDALCDRVIALQDLSEKRAAAAPPLP